MAKPIELDLPEVPRDERMTAQEYVYDRLRNALMIGLIEPGTALTIRALAGYMKASPTPVREALRRLSSEHAVEVLSNRRIIIPEMPAERFEDLIELRAVVETHAALRALPYLSDIVIDRMRAIDDEMDVALALNHYDDLAILNQRFHRCLYEANPNRATMPLVQSVWLQLGPFQRQIVQAIKRPHFIDHHKEILLAVRARDRAALADAIAADIRDSALLQARGIVAQRTSKVA